MKVFLYMAISANGYIARQDDNTDWVSEQEWKNYLSVLKSTGCAVIGRRTYDLIDANDEVANDCFYVVMTSNKKMRSHRENVLFTTKGAKNIVELLSAKGFAEMCISGGSKVNSTFAKAHLIDEVFLDIEPIILGNGIPLFHPKSFELDLKLVGVSQLKKDLVQLHYKVRR